MTVEEVRDELGLEENWLEGRKVTDDLGNIVREFKNKDNEDENWRRYVVTNPSDDEFLFDISTFGPEVSAKDLKNSNRPYERYVFCIQKYNPDFDGNEAFAITYLSHWQSQNCLFDLGGTLSFDDEQKFNLAEVSECIYEPCDGTYTIEQIRQKFLADGRFVEDPDFEEAVNDR